MSDKTQDKRMQLASKLTFLIVTVFACNIPSASTPTPDLFATLQTLSTPTVDLPQSPEPEAEPIGKIAFVCQIFKTQAQNQICIINADGTGFRRLTAEDNRQHYYPSVAPDGKSVVYAAFREPNIYEIYEHSIDTNEVKQLTDRLGNLNGPEISPDGSLIAFKLSTGASNQIWLMERDGSNPRPIPNAFGWDPTWSPDAHFILFASDMAAGIQLYKIRLDGSELQRVSELPAIRGRSDWSPNSEFIVTYSGEPWKRDVYMMNADGSNAHVLTPTGGNSQGPSISPDGLWVAFTAYFDGYGEDHGCEIYIIRMDGTDLRRITNNDYCDYQPRWGP
ncbi:MAG: PD40 domain-containing protein [Anaerolineales bacterium]|nr:PD40 domain-containing protein [Anaerolineales bacterium]MCB9144211.1 PD40 domain-containing protein [Anaerolineales bacterium]